MYNKNKVKSRQLLSEKIFKFSYCIKKYWRSDVIIVVVVVVKDKDEISHTVKWLLVQKELVMLLFQHPFQQQ